MSILLQDVGVDHGGTHVPVSQKGLDGADVRTKLQEMSGEAVPERMCTDSLVDSRLAEGLGNGFVDGAAVEVVAAHLAGSGVSGPMAGGENVLPSPISVGIRVLVRQGVREMHLPAAFFQIPLVDHFHADTGLFQRLYELLGKRPDAVFITLSVPHGEGLHLQVDVLDPESKTFGDAQAGAVQKLDNELVYSGHQCDHAGRLFTGQNDGYPGLLARAVCVDFSTQWLLEHVLVEENKGIHGLVLGGSSYLVIPGQVGEECFDLLFPASQVVPGLHVVETDIALDPIAVGVFGMDGIMTPPHKVAHFVTYSGRHANLPGLCHVRNLISGSFGRLRAMMTHMADLLETGPDIVLSGRSA